jgi:transcriptional regulator with XRE-family HTH domain
VSEHPTVTALRWILENRRDADGNALSMRRLSLLAGLTAGHVEQILNERQSADIEISTAVKLARAGNVRLRWLVSGLGEREPFQEEERAVSNQPLELTLAAIEAIQAARATLVAARRLPHGGFVEQGAIPAIRIAEEAAKAADEPLAKALGVLLVRKLDLEGQR